MKAYLNGLDVLNHGHERLLADPFVDLDEKEFGFVTHGLITIFEKWNHFWKEWFDWKNFGSEFATDTKQNVVHRFVSSITIE